MTYFCKPGVKTSKPYKEASLRSLNRLHFISTKKYQISSPSPNRPKIAWKEKWWHETTKIAEENLKFPGEQIIEPTLKRRTNKDSC